MPEERQDVIPEDGMPDTPIEAPSFQRRLAVVILTAIGIQLLFLVFRECVQIRLCEQFTTASKANIDTNLILGFYDSLENTTKYYPVIALLLLEITILIAATYYGINLLVRAPNGTTRLRAAAYIITIYLIALVFAFIFYESITAQTSWREPGVVGEDTVIAVSYIDGYRRVWSWIPVIVGVIAPAWAWFLLRPRRVDADPPSPEL